MKNKKIFLRPFLVILLVVVFSGWSASSAYNLSGLFTVDGKTIVESDGMYTSNMTDVSAIYVTNQGDLSLTNSTIYTTGNTSSLDDSSFYGLNGALLANNGSMIFSSGGSIVTLGSGANGAIPTGNGTSITLSNTSISAPGDGAHGIMATLGASLSFTDGTIVTTGPHGAPVATDRGGGSVCVTRGTVQSSGADSPGIYSTGVITIEDSTISSTGSEACVIEGSNSVSLSDSDVSGGASETGGIMIYQSFSGDATTGTGILTMNGGSYSATTGPAFFVTNTDAEISLNGVNISVPSGILIKAAGTTRWGTAGSNGGVVTFIADNEEMTGSLVTDEISSIHMILKNGSVLTGSINTSSLTVSDNSSWQVTENSTLTSLTDQEGISGDVITNIIGNGFVVTYDSNLSENAYLGGKEYSLTNGGILIPKSPGSTTAISLQPGWNHVSVARSLATGYDTAQIFAGVNSSGRSILMYQDDTTGYRTLKEVDPITPLQGYWLFSENATTVPIKFNELVTGSSRDVPAGWSSVGGWAEEDISANDTFHTLMTGWSYAIGYDAVAQQYLDPIVRGGTGNQSDSRPIQPYLGYWLYCSQNGTYQSGFG